MNLSRIAIPLAAIALSLLLTSCAGSGRSRGGREVSRYSHRMHTRFYEAWTPPASLSAARGKISVPVDILIDREGRVRSFTLAQPSGYAAVDESIREAGGRVRRVAPPPQTAAMEEFHLRIFFELDVKR